jgi:hypothetical protein
MNTGQVVPFSKKNAAQDIYLSVVMSFYRPNSEDEVEL